MAEPARNISQVAPIQTDSSDQAQEPKPIPSWQRQPGESLLWYNRFKLYRNLGYKRSLVAALAKEQETAQVLKSPRTGEKPGVKKAPVSQKRDKSSTKVAQLSEVPKLASAQVPGSWKQASIKYKWVERAAAYDESRIDQMVEQGLDDLLDGAGTSFNRVMMLKSLLEILRTNINTNGKNMSFEQFCMWVQRMQSVTKQIADEMSTYDEAVTRAVLRHISINVHQHRDLQKIVDKAAETPGGIDQALQEIAQEKRRRGL